ncbi:MAG: hypothetical protein QW261_13960 [Candidatus Jordarchaeaceae archaeon]
MERAISSLPDPNLEKMRKRERRGGKPVSDGKRRKTPALPRGIDVFCSPGAVCGSWRCVFPR